MIAPTEPQAFADRLRQALQGVGVRPSPTVVANEFNLRYWGRSITSHTARNWLLGKAIPTQDKLRVLADWLQVGPDTLRFGLPAGKLVAREPDRAFGELNLADREMLARYLSLPMNDRKVAREVVAALAIAAELKQRISDPAAKPAPAPASAAT